MPREKSLQKPSSSMLPIHCWSWEGKLCCWPRNHREAVKKKARASLKSVQNLFVTARSQPAFYSLNLALLLFPYGSARGYGFLILCIDLVSELFSGYIMCLCTACQAFVMISEFMPCQSASPHTGSHTVHHLKSPNEVFWLNKIFIHKVKILHTSCPYH